MLKAVIVPVYKGKGDKNYHKCYKGKILSKVSKVDEKLVNDC